MDFMLLESLLNHGAHEFVVLSVLLSLKVIIIILQALIRCTRQSVGVFLITLYICAASLLVYSHCEYDGNVVFPPTIHRVPKDMSLHVNTQRIS